MQPCSFSGDQVTANHIGGITIAQGVAVPQTVVQGVAHVIGQGPPHQLAQEIIPAGMTTPSGRAANSYIQVDISLTFVIIHIFKSSIMCDIILLY